MKIRKLECGCMFEDGGDGYWWACTTHVNSQLHKVRKAHAEVVVSDPQEPSPPPEPYDAVAVIEGMTEADVVWGDNFAKCVYAAMCNCSDQPSPLDVLGIALADARRQGREAALP